jgi:hypothetical protein
MASKKSSRMNIMLQSLVASVQPLIILVQGPPAAAPCSPWDLGQWPCLVGERKTREFPIEKDGFSRDFQGHFGTILGIGTSFLDCGCA